MKGNGDASARAALTITNVEPQIKVVTTQENFGFRTLIIALSDFRFWTTALRWFATGE